MAVTFAIEVTATPTLPPAVFLRCECTCLPAPAPGFLSVCLSPSPCPPHYPCKIPYRCKRILALYDVDLSDFTAQDEAARGLDKQAQQQERDRESVRESVRLASIRKREEQLRQREQKLHQRETDLQVPEC